MRRRTEGRSSSSGLVSLCSHEVDGCLGRLPRSQVAPSDISIWESGKLGDNGSSTSIGRWVNRSCSSASNAFYEAGSDRFTGCSGKSWRDSSGRSSIRISDNSRGESSGSAFRSYLMES